MGILDDAIRDHLDLKRRHGASDVELRLKEEEVFGPVRAEALPAPPDERAEAAAPPAGEEPTRHHELELEPLEADSHDHLHPGGSDPAWGDDAELFGEPAPAAAEEPAAAAPAAPEAPPVEEPEEEPPPVELPEAPPAEPPPPEPPTRSHHEDDEPHPALHDHRRIEGEELPPEPVFRARPAPSDAPAEPEAPLQPDHVDDPDVGDPAVEYPDDDEPPPRQSPDEHGEHADPSQDVLEETPEFLQDAPEHDRLWFEQKPPRDFDFGD